jgi:hypothetical protein
MMEGANSLASVSIFHSVQMWRPLMSLRNDQSPEVMALDAAVEANRRAESVRIPPAQELLDAAQAQAGDLTIASVVKLCARAPWFDDLAALYGFNVSRWDSPANLIYCFPNQAPPGSWDGTVVYVDFTAPQPGDYRILARYHGPNAQVRLRGPWGIVSETMPSGQETDLVEASWSGSGELFFTLTFSGQWMGMVGDVEIFRLY